MNENERNTAQPKMPIDFVARAEQIINTQKPIKKKQKRMSTIDSVINFMILTCCLMLTGILFYLLNIFPI